jgi:ferredoxin-NADP reductase
MQEFTGRIVIKKFLTLRVIEFEVELDTYSALEFTPGQFMQFKFGAQFRSYSIVSVPSQDGPRLRFCAELLEHGVASEFFRRAEVGAGVELRGPSGNFIFDNFSTNIFMIATGVGVAPFVSMIPDALARGFENKMHLLFGVRTEEDVFYFERFSHLASMYQNFKFTPILSRPKSHWPGEVGRVTTYVDVAYEYYTDYFFYLCGGIEAVKDLRALLQRKGHSQDRVKLEIFTPPQPLSPS